MVGAIDERDYLNGSLLLCFKVRKCSGNSLRSPAKNRYYCSHISSGITRLFRLSDLVGKPLEGIIRFALSANEVK